MTKNNKTYSPAHAITIEAKEDIPAFRFISHLGSVCEADTKSLGVSEVDWLNGDLAAIVTLGSIAIETTTTVDIGDDVTSDTGGKAKKVTASEPVNGRALSSTTGAGFVTVNLVP